MAASFTQRVSIPANVMFRELEGESVILDLDSERYFGLDRIGTRMWQLLTESASIQAAYEVLLGEYDVDSGMLEADLKELVDALLERGLLEIDDG